MNLSFTLEEETFRQEVKDFLADNLTPELRAYARRMTSVYASKEVALEWQAILVKQGWAAPAWPVEYGGTDWTVAQRYIYDVEMARAGAPPLSPMGIGMCGPALIGHGSKAQKDFYLPRILSGEDFWCQGYSEPHAGSDLAALTMPAVEDGDDFVCNGSKIWTTHAHEANMMFCLVRTDATGKPQQGITFLLIDMQSPGVTVDPIIMLSGEHIQNAVFFSDVRVPKANVIGRVNDGWTVAKYLLEFERGGSAYGPRLLSRLRSIRQAAAEEGGLEPGFARKLSLAEAGILALEAAELQQMSDLAGGGTPGLKASMMKIRGTELSQHLTELALELAGVHAAPFQPQYLSPGGPVPVPDCLDLSRNVPEVGPESALTVASKYLNDRAGSIYAGSNEIQRGILAKGQIGLRAGALRSEGTASQNVVVSRHGLQCHHFEKGGSLLGVTADKWSTGADGPYWDGLAEGRLLLPACAECGRWHWPAVWRCPACGSWDQDWRQVSVEGCIYSWTRTRHAFAGLEALETPFVIAVVELKQAGGIRLMGRLETGNDDVRIGQRVAGVISRTHCLGQDVPCICWRRA